MKKANYCKCVFVINHGERNITQLRYKRSSTKEINSIVACDSNTDGSLEITNVMAGDMRTLVINIVGWEQGCPNRSAVSRLPKAEFVRR